MSGEDGEEIPGVLEAIEGGISLRDYFAGQALAGLCANQEWLVVAHEKIDGDVNPALAGVCYSIADAVLEERSKP